MMLHNGEISEQDRAADKKDRKKEQIIENLVPNVLSEGIEGNNRNRSHSNLVLYVSALYGLLNEQLLQ